MELKQPCQSFKVVKMSKEKIVVLGAGGHAKVIIDIIEKNPNQEILGVYDDFKIDQNILFYRVKGNTQKLIEDGKRENAKFIVALGSNQLRQEKFELLLKVGLIPAIAIHPSSSISPHTTIGLGSAVMAKVAINPGTIVGRNVIINTCASLDHDNMIGDHAHVAPNATLCGNVHVGERTWVGAGVTIIEGIAVGKDCLVAAGATVVRNVFDQQRVAGVPAKQMKQVIHTE
jgi:sugar O-acyltransferase (sialic acid O-acetyltransferase NeuD family)